MLSIQEHTPRTGLTIPLGQTYLIEAPLHLRSQAPPSSPHGSSSTHPLVMGELVPISSGLQARGGVHPGQVTRFLCLMDEMMDDVKQSNKEINPKEIFTATAFFKFQIL
ncbi:hypothetical protein ILYODFUR_011375 [Ilyodon furcidens]|uniref:Uncharacterized protein n=1 Tax=Ilyodon furcidens TaxID=33524 RepID=A0ABV0SW19_9TELE